MTALDTMTEIVANGTMSAFAQLAKRSGAAATLDIDKAIAAIRTAIKAHIDDGSMLAEWGEAAEAVISDAWKAEVIKLQCFEYAHEAWKAYNA